MAVVRHHFHVLVAYLRHEYVVRLRILLLVGSLKSAVCIFYNALLVAWITLQYAIFKFHIGYGFFYGV